MAAPPPIPTNPEPPPPTPYVAIKPRWERALPVISNVAFAIFVLAGISILVLKGQWPHLSNTIAYVPAGVVGGVALITFVATKILSHYKEKFLLKMGICPSLRKRLLAKPTLHPTLPEPTIPFCLEEDPPLREIREGDLPRTAFVLLNDFMGFDVDLYPVSTRNALSILINSLHAFERSGYVQNTQAFQSFVDDLKFSYKLTCWIEQLRAIHNDKARYLHGRQVIKKALLEALQQRGRLYLPGGYKALPAGHHVLIELFYKNGKVSGRVHNRGEGLEYHGGSIGQKEHGDVLLLGETSLEALESSLFLESFCDLQMLRLPAEDRDEGVGSTSYTIEDVYESFLPSWPGEIDFPNTKREKNARSHQRSGSCTMKPFLGLLKERLGEEGKQAKLFSGMYALELLLNKIALKNRERSVRIDGRLIDSNRIQEAVAKLNREAHGQKNLPKALRDRLRALTLRAKQIYRGHAALVQTGCDYSKLNLSRWEDAGIGNLSPHASYPPSRAEGDNLPPVDALPTIRKESLIEDMATAIGKLRDLEQEQKLPRARWVARAVIDRLPGPTDPYWREEHLPDETIEQFAETLGYLFKGSTCKNGPLRVTSNEAMLYYKLQIILLHQCEKSGIPDEVLDRYRRSIRAVIYAREPFCFLTHPKFAKLMRDCRKALGEGEMRSIEAIDLPRNIPEMKETPEWNFLYEFVTHHPELKDRPILETAMALFTDRDPSAIDMPSDTSSEDSDQNELPSSDMSPIKRWKALRRTVFRSLIPTGNLGTISGQIGGIEMGVLIHFPHLERESEYEIEHFTPSNDPDLLFETFAFLTPEAKEALRTLLLHQNIQNVQLKEQEGIENFLNPSEYQELLSIRTNDRWKLPQIIGFFERHFHRFKQREFQALFQLFLFSSTVDRENRHLTIEEISRCPSAMKEMLFSFFHQALEQTKKLGWTEAHLMFLRSTVAALRYAVEADVHSPLIAQVMEGLIKQIDSLLISRNKRGEIFHTLVALAPYCDHPAFVPLLDRARQAKEQIDVVGLACNLSEQLQWHEDHTLAEDLLQNDGQASCLLPRQITQTTLYRSHFSHNYRATRNASGHYLFTDETGVDYLIETNWGYPSLYRKIDREWYKSNPAIQACWKNEEDQVSFPGSANGYFQQDAHYWFDCSLSLDSSRRKVFVFSQKTGECKCRIRNDRVYHPTLPLKLASDYKHPSTKALSRLAGGENTLIWANAENRVCRIEIPRLSLTFVFEEGRWFSKEYPGFFLDPSYLLPIFRPGSRYLVLRNGLDKRLVLLAKEKIIPTKQKGPYLMPVNYPSQRGREYIAYPLSRSGQIILPHDPEKLLYLNYMAMRTFDYSLSKKILDKLRRERPELTNKAASWIKELDANTEVRKWDTHPEAIALRLHARLLAHRLSSEVLSDLQTQILKIDYFEYLARYRHTYKVRLSPKEERAVLQLLEASQVRFTVRQAHQKEIRKYRLGMRPSLPKTYVNTDLPHKAKTQYWNFSIQMIANEHAEEMWAHLEDPLPVGYTTRPGSTLLKNFLYYYSIARHFPRKHPLLLELQHLLQTSARDADHQLRDLYKYLRSVIADPLQFPTIEYLRYSNHPLGDLLRVNKLIGCQSEELFSFLEKTKGKSLPTHFVPPKKELKTSQPTLSAPVATTLVPMPNRNIASELAALSYVLPQDQKERRAALKHKGRILIQMRDTLKKRAAQSESPSTKRVYEARLKGLRKKLFQLQQDLKEETPPLRLNLETLDVFAETLRDKFLEPYTERLEREKRAIEKLAHTYPLDMHLEVHGDLLVLLSIDELCTYVATGDDAAIARSNPSLTEEKLAELKNRVLDYAILETERQHFVRIADELSHLIDRRDENEPLDPSLLMELITSRRVYNPAERPEYLMFELFENVRIRSEQGEALSLFSNDQRNIEFQARTGFGKSSVLSPLLLFLKSRKEGLSMMSVPRSLFSAQYRHLQDVLGKAFDTIVIPLKFDRNRANDLSYLREINEKLREAEQENKILLTTTHALHGMSSLKLKESLIAGGGETEKALQKELFALRRQIAEKVFTLADESKVSFDLAHRNDYAIGSLTPVDRKKLKTAIDLYRLFFIDTDLLERVNFEFLPQAFSPEKQTLPKEEYETALLPFFEEKLHEKMGEISPLQAKQLYVHLKRTLFRKCGDHYDFYQGTRIAKPHRDGTTRKQNEYSHVEDLLDFTIQANLKRDFESKEIEDFFDKLKLKSIEGESNHPKLRKFLAEVCGSKGLIELSAEDYQSICRLVNETLYLRLDFIELAILPEIKVYPKKVTSTPYNLLRLPRQVHAMSATTMGELLPRLTLEPDPLADIDNLVALWERPSFTLLHRNDPEERLKELLEAKPDANVLVDIAGTFRDFTPLQIAQQILATRTEIPGVLVYDQEGKPFVLLRGKEELVPKEACYLAAEELFIYLRKSKTVGTNIVLPSTIEATATFDRDTDWNRLVQGIGRLRKLPQGQTIHLACGIEDRGLIFGEEVPDLESLFAYTIEKQGLEDGTTAFYALRLFGEDLVYKAIWEEVDKEETLEKKRAAFHPFRELFVRETQPTSTTPHNQRGKKFPAADALKALETEIFSQLETFCMAHPKVAKTFDLPQMKEAFHTFAATLALPKEISLGSEQEGVSVVDVTTDQARDVAVTAESLNMQETEADLPKVNFTAATPLLWNGDYHSWIAKQAPFTTLLDIPIYHSPNFPRVSRDPKENKKVQKPAYQTLLIEEGGHFSLLLLDLYDAEKVFAFMSQNSTPHPEKNAYLYSGEHTILTDGQTPRPPSALQLRILRKLFVAYPRLTDREKVYLRTHEGRKAFTAHVKSMRKVWPHLTPFANSLAKAPQPK